MYINSITLKNFRNHINKNINFITDLTVINGFNGIGKTNILEAIYILATGRSIRARYDKDMINYEYEYCSIHGLTRSMQYEYDLEVQIVKSAPDTNISYKRAKVNKVTRSMQHLIGLFNAVLFSPQDIDLVIGSPGDRRRFIDNVLVQTDKNYKKKLSEYNKAIKQRNKILEMINEFSQGEDQLGYWTETILHLGKYLQQIRETFLNYLNKKTLEYIRVLDQENTSLSIKYKKNEISTERLEKHYHHEIASKTTLVGPHRDDFEMVLNEHNLADFGSRGQQRTVILAIKLAEVDYFEQEIGERPVLLLDDIFSELDEHHKKMVMETIGRQQTIITFAEKPDYTRLDKANLITLE